MYLGRALVLSLALTSHVLFAMLRSLRQRQFDASVVFDVECCIELAGDLVCELIQIELGGGGGFLAVGLFNSREPKTVSLDNNMMIEILPLQGAFLFVLVSVAGSGADFDFISHIVDGNAVSL